MALRNLMQDETTAGAILAKAIRNMWQVLKFINHQHQFHQYILLSKKLWHTIINYS